MRVHSDAFIVQVQFAEDGAQPIPIRKLAEDTQAWLDGLNPADVREEIGVKGLLGSAQHIWQHERSGWSVALAPIPRSTNRPGGRVVGVTGPHVRWIDDRTPIREALYEKAHKFGDELGKPLLVALGLLRTFADDIDIIDALFGDDVYLLDPSTGDGTSARKANGLLIGSDGPHSCRLSAVLVGKDVAPWSAARTGLALWKHPAATFPVHCDAGGVLTIIDPQDDGSFVTTPATVSTGELFGLPLDWPGPEPPFTRN